MAISNLLVPGVQIPRSDTSWLSGLFDSLGGAVDQYKENKAYNSLADRIGGSGGPQATPQAQPQQMASAGPSMGGTAPVMPVDRGAPQGDTYQPFIETVKSRVTNPYGLAAVAATGRAESGWSGANANRSWSDPSQSGQPGTAGGVMSWRAERLANLQKFAAGKGEQGNGSPQTQAEFFLNEDPQLISRLNQAKSPTEAADIIAGSWKFAGYDQQGGEAARRRALAQNYYSNEFSGMPMEQGDASPAAYVDPMVSTPNSGPAPASAAPAQASMPNAMADSGGEIIAPGMAPIQRGGVDPETIQFMLRDPKLREIGVKLWAANAQGQKASEPWQFVQLPDGTLARANQQTGQVENIGQYAKQQEAPTSFREFQLAKENGFTGSYADWEKVKTPGGTNVTVNNQDQGEFSKKAAARNVDRFGNLADAGTSAAGVAQSMPVLRELLTQAPQGPVSGRLAETFPGFSTAGDAFMAQVSQIAPTLRVPGSGAASDKDMDMLMSSLPRLRSDPAANQLILNVFEKKAQLNAQRGAIASQALRGEITPEEADKQISEIDKVPLLDERSRSMLQTTTGGTAKPQTKADFDALKSGDLYIDPDDGQTYRKR